MAHGVSGASVAVSVVSEATTMIAASPIAGSSAPSPLQPATHSTKSPLPRKASRATSGNSAQEAITTRLLRPQCAWLALAAQAED